MAIYSFSSSQNVENARTNYKNWNASSQTANTQATTNNGGLLGGLGFLAEKLAVGFVSSIEGGVDYVTSGLAKLFGNDEWAEDIIANDWFGDWYSHPEEWYNPSGFMRTAGDVAGGIGTSLPGLIAATAITVATGGAGAGSFAAALAPLGAAVTSGLGAAGNAVKSAYKETGNLDAKTYGYGALSGFTEGSLEGVTTALSLGGGAVVKSFAKALGKETAKTVAKQGVLKTLASSFAGEFFEEATSEILDPVWKRMTYDPSAAFATPQEVLYSGFVGGLSGVVMGGTGVVFDSGTSFAKGTNIANRGGATEVLNTANDLSSWATENNVDDEVFKTIEDTRNKLSLSLQQTGGQVVTVTQKKLLGDLYRQNVATSANMFVAQRALNIVSNAPQVAQRLSEYGYKHKTTGQTYSVTAEEITKGYDPSNPSSIYKALRKNETLRSLAVADATGKLLLDSAKFTHATLAGRKLASQVDLNRFLETATSQEINAVSQALGIDSWASLDADSFAKKIEQFIENGGVQQNVSTRERIKMLQAIPAESARAIPKRINLKSGKSARYTDGSLDIGVSKDGDSYLIHDYKSGYTTKSLTVSDVNKRLASYNTEKTAIMEDVQKQVDEAARLQKEAAEADTYARENVDGYSELSEPNKGMIRRLIRDAKAKGISDSDALLYARVSARSGVDVVFDFSLKKGESALYDEKKNRIVVNPNSKRGAERILIHELDHAIRQYLGKDGKVHAVIPYKEALKRVSPKTKMKIIVAYADQDTDVSRTELYLDEISAYHAEYILGNKNVLEKLLEVEPTLKDKILNFFKNASNDPNERLSGYAKKFYRTYKKMFDSFAERNAQANASEEGGLTRIKKSMPKPTVTGEEEEEKDNTRKSFSSISRTFLGDKYVTKEGKGAEEISVEEFKSIDYRETEGYRNYVQECLDNMRQSIPDFNEQDARKEIEDSIRGIVDVAVAMKEAGYDIIDDPTWRENGEVRKDSKKRALFSSLEPNSDYFTSSDISTICDKRKNFTEIYDDIVREEERRGVPESKRFFKNVDNYFYIHKVLADKGLTQPCRECYVESMRKNLAPMAEAFRTLITESNESNTSNPQLYEQSGKKKGQLKSNNSETRKFVRDALAEYEVSPESITIDMLSTEEGLATLKIQMPLVYEAFNSFYGQSKPKMPRGATPFRFGELTALLTKDDGTINKNLVKKIASTGGFRLQSYSDFQIQNFVDVLQVLFEAGTLGLTGHAYTKVPAFLEATKNTNLKRNISIFMYNDEGVWKIDRNDSFPMSLEEIYKVVDSDKSGNTGIIAVSQNEKMAAWVMANDDVAYFIPFHKSGVKMGTVRETIVREGGREILGYADIKDHTRQQSEVYADTADGHKANTKVKKPIDIYSFWDFENTENLSQKDLIKKNLTAYIDECKKAGYKPKFREYVENNASVLKNILRYGKELGYLTEDATIDDISFEHGGYRIPYGYYKCLVDYNLFTPDGKASPAERLSLKNYKFDEAVEFFKDSEKLRRTELLQQFANDGERQKYAKLAAEGMSNAELENVIRQKRQEVVTEILDQGNSKSVRKAIDIDEDIDIDEAIEATRASISMEDASYKATKRDKIFSLWTQFQIAVTNEQAGVEVVGKQLGIKDIEAKVQAVRSARTEANEMIGGQQMRIGVSATKDNMNTLVQGEGLIPIMKPITKQGEVVTKDFFGYLFHKHNQSRMTLRKRSLEWHQQDVDALKKDIDTINDLKAQIEALEKQINELGRTRHDMEIKNGLRERVKRLKAEAKALNTRAKTLSKKVKEFVPLEDKPVLGWVKDEDGHIIPTTPDEDATPYTAEESEEIVARYEKDHPEFAEQAEKLWGFLKNLNQYRVDTGLLSKDNFDYLAELYPHYVPTYRVDTKKGIGAIEGKYNMAVKTTVKTAKGSTKDLQPPDKIIARQVMETIVAGRVNQLANALYDASVAKGDTTHIEVVSRKKMTPEEAAAYDPTEYRPKDNEITFFKDGERITIRVSKEIFAGFDAFSPKTDIGNPLIDFVSASNKLFKRGVTSLNPAFLLRNTIRDIQDAGINTRYGKTFLKNYAIAQKEIATNGKYWQLYRAYGGFSSSVFDFEKGTDGSQNSWGLTKAEGNIVKKTMTTIENANAFVEQLPRLAEFISSIEAGNSVEQAILDSADVTTNFARGGKLAKALNRTVMPFLNPSIQGFSKMVRNVTAVRTVKEAAILALKATIVGIAPMVLNMIMNGDDEDYKKLRDSDKENNFLIKAGDTFIKIPRGRVASALGGLVNRSVEAAQGEVVDWKDYADNVLQQVSPVDSMSRTIFSPFIDVATNTTWYGSTIEGRQFENVAPKDRFDENTSVIAIAISWAHDLVGLEASPKKIHYLLDQYSGVIGDFILPATTPKEEKDFFTGNFTLDPVMSNKLSTRFYDIYDEAQYADTAGDDTAKYQVRYLNRVKKAISDMYKEKSKTQNNAELSRAEKLEQTRVIQVLINKAYETAIDDYELMTKAIEATSSIEEEDIRFAEAYRLVYGAQASLEQYNKDVYEKMQYLNKGGVDYDSLYSFYFGTRGITSDKDRNGNTIAGSKRKKVVSYINKLGLSRNQKLLLITSMGYSPADGDVVGMDAESAKKSLLRYILTLKGASKEERAEIASICGFETKNGAILNTFHAKTA